MSAVAVAREAVVAAVEAGLRAALGSWPADLVRGACAGEDVVTRTSAVHRRVARFRLATLRSPALTAACALICRDPVQVAWDLRLELLAQLEHVCAGAPPGQLPNDVIELVEKRWPNFLMLVAEHLVPGEDHHG